MGTEKKGGGKLSRSKTVTIRLDPKLLFAVQLVARRNRRTLSSFIEWTLDCSLGDQMEPYPAASSLISEYATINSLLTDVWDDDEAARFLKLASSCPDLLSLEEERLWRVVRQHYGLSPDFGDALCYRIGGNMPLLTYESCVASNLADHWQVFNAVASGDQPDADLPQDIPKRPNDD